MYNWVIRTPDGRWLVETSGFVPIDFFLDSGETRDLGEFKLREE